MDWLEASLFGAWNGGCEQNPSFPENFDGLCSDTPIPWEGSVARAANPCQSTATGSLENAVPKTSVMTVSYRISQPSYKEDALSSQELSYKSLT